MECDHQATSKSHITQHQQTINEATKYPCIKGSLAQDQQAIHEGKKFQCKECDHQATVTSGLTSEQFRKERSSQAGNVINR